MFRKFMLLLGLAALLSLTLGAFGQGVSLVMWSKEGGPILEFSRQLAQQFGERTGNTIEVVNFDVEDLRQQFLAASLADAAPDLLWTVNDHAGVFQAAGTIQPVDNIFDLSRFLPAGLEAVVLDGQTYGVPITVGNHLMLMVNRKLVSEDQYPTTTDQLIAVAQALTNADAGQFGLAYNLNEPFWLAPWLSSFDTWFYAEDGLTPTLNTPGMVATLQFLHDLKFVARITPQEADYNGAISLFKEGRAAFHINGDWSLAELRDPALAEVVDLAVIPLPTVSATSLNPRPLTSGTYFMLPTGLAGDKLQVAIDFINYVTSDEVQLAFLEQFSRLPSTLSAAASPLITQDPVLSGSAAQVALGRPMPTIARQRCVWDAIRPGQEAVMADAQTPAAAAEAMQASVETCIADLGE